MCLDFECIGLSSVHTVNRTKQRRIFKIGQQSFMPWTWPGHIMGTMCSSDLWNRIEHCWHIVKTDQIALARTLSLLTSMCGRTILWNKLWFVLPRSRLGAQAQQLTSSTLDLRSRATDWQSPTTFPFCNSSEQFDLNPPFILNSEDDDTTSIISQDLGSR